MLRGSHLSHDSILEDDVTVSCNVLIGGETYVMKGANLALGSIIHQKQTVGSYAMLGMGAIATASMEIMPGKIYVGNPAHFLKVNSVGLERNKITSDLLAKEFERFHRIRATKVRQ
jgi:UDP-N-acetylglucosamine acyltransferase